MKATCSILRALVCVLSFASCAHIGLQQHPVAIHTEKIRTATGVTYEDLVLGMGRAAETGDRALIDYTVWLESGERVDSTLDRGVPINVTLGSAPIKGLDEGLLGMMPKGHRKLVIPSELAYGAQGVAGMIPPGATLVFEVHAIKISERSQPKSSQPSAK